MLQKLLRIFGDGALALSVLLGPGMWVFAFAAGYSAWLTGNSDVSVLGFLWMSFTSASWALWGLMSGPERLRQWWFCLASFLNMLAGVAILVSDRPYACAIGVLFLGYSLWQFLVFNRPAPPRWPLSEE